MQPEKILVFGPMVVFLIIFSVIVFIFLRVVIKLIVKGRAQAWKGELIDKIYKTNRDFDNSKKINEFYTLVFRTEEGKIIKVGTSKLVYDDYKVGDRAEKKSGEFWPNKII